MLLSKTFASHTLVQQFHSSALWESLACHPIIWISLLYHFLTVDLKGNEPTGVTFDPY